MDNVAQGMTNIGQPWAVAPSPHLMTMAGTTEPLNVTPGISGTGLPAEMTSAVEANNGEARGVALFTNPQGVWNDCFGTWDPLPGHIWNGKFWAETKQREAQRQTARTKADRKKPASKARAKREQVTSSDEDSDVKPRRRRFKAAVKQAVADPKLCSTERIRSDKRQVEEENRPSESCFKCGKSGHWAAFCTVQPKSFACIKPGHFACECPDADLKALGLRRPEASERPQEETHGGNGTMQAGKTATMAQPQNAIQRLGSTAGKYGKGSDPAGTDGGIRAIRPAFVTKRFEQFEREAELQRTKSADGERVNDEREGAGVLQDGDGANVFRSGKGDRVEKRSGEESTDEGLLTPNDETDRVLNGDSTAMTEGISSNVSNGTVV
ncbi:unnamed protein product [Phytophthora fragariaefolia]|uniref:Unnamed protein product n=1 Tax=Phytophthora fragariaefolia TaxID=1490495 RepID=A0A9W7D968_9STRA|nr:unnamed protein product [Phytophthora fragariaefolia]